MSADKKTTLVALGRRREYTIDVLTEAFAKDLLDVDEFEQRVDGAHQATSIEALEKLITDLEPAPDQSEALTVQPEAAQALDISRPERKRIVAIMGGSERKGQWLVPKKLSVTTIMGGADLDFREAVLAPGVTEVKVRTIMGGVEITVPPNVAVEAEGFAIMGGFEEVHRAPPVPDPERPLIRISGFAIMGGFDISTRLPGESRWQARRRQRKERKALRKRARKQLQAGRRELGDGSDTD